MVALFLKDVGSYKRCQDGIRENNYWILVIESCKWMGAWKLFNKTTYLTLQSEYIELFYGKDFDPWLRETARRNSMCVFTDRLRSVAMDEACEIFNAWLKKPAATTYLSVQCLRSRHIMFERKCAGTIFGVHKRGREAGASEAANLLLIESVLHKAGIFHSHDKVTMTDDYFWSLIKKRTKVGSENDKQKEEVPLTQHEQLLNDRFCTHDYVPEEDYTAVEDADYNDDSDSVVSSCMGSVDGHDDIDVDDHETVNSPTELEQWKELTDAEKVQDGVEHLKKLGNVKRRKYNKLALTDCFVHGDQLLMKTIKEDRKKAIAKMKRKFTLVQMSIDYFCNKMEKRRAILLHAIDKSKTHVFVLSARDHKVQNIMMTRRAAGLTNPQS